MRCLFVVMALLYTLLTLLTLDLHRHSVEAQVNFSPAWGKRSGDLLVETAKEDPTGAYRRMLQGDNCNTPLECLIRMQRLMQLQNRKSRRSIRCEMFRHLC